MEKELNFFFKFIIKDKVFFLILYYIGGFG